MDGRVSAADTPRKNVSRVSFASIIESRRQESLILFRVKQTGDADAWQNTSQLRKIFDFIRETFCFPKEIPLEKY